MTAINNKFFIDPIPPGMRAALESVQRYQETIRPHLEMVNLAQSALASASPALEWYHNNPATIAAIKSISTTSLSQASAIADSTEYILRNIANGALHNAITSPVIQWFESIQYSPIYTFLDTIASVFDVDIEKDEYAKYYREQMYFARWFPYAGSVLNADYVEQINDAWSHTRDGSKNRIKQTDKIVFAFYTKTEIEYMRKSWKDLDLPKYLIKILNQAVQAYRRGEYAMTVCALTTLWEGIICDKANDPSFRTSNKTKDNLKRLVDENEYDSILYSFCDDFIFYNCKSPEEVKEDVPGRHGIAHCWYNKYPTKKAALNAILFTDFLLNLEPTENAEESE